MKAMGIIFANIYDSSLGELTNKRTIASLPYGGRYRQIDFTLSNMSNSGIRHIGVITKYNYQSLMNHIGSGQEWDLDLEEGGLEYLKLVLQQWKIAQHIVKIMEILFFLFVMMTVLLLE